MVIKLVEKEIRCEMSPISTMVIEHSRQHGPKHHKGFNLWVKLDFNQTYQPKSKFKISKQYRYQLMDYGNQLYQTISYRHYWRHMENISNIPNIHTNIIRYTLYRLPQNSIRYSQYEPWINCQWASTEIPMSYIFIRSY